MKYYNFKKIRFFFFSSQNINQRGISLYLTILIMFVLLGAVLALSTILLGQLKVVKGMENSVAAFYAADSGVERALLEVPEPAVLGESWGETLDNGAEYNVEVVAPGEKDCPGDVSYCLQSKGIYRKTQRAIETSTPL